MMEQFGVLVKQSTYQTKTGETIIEYHFALKNGIYLGYLRFPADLQYCFDIKILAVICKAVAARWGLVKPKKKN